MAQVIARRFPDDQDLLSPIDQGATPRSSGVSTQLTPRLLDRDEIGRRLSRLTGWEGDEHRLRRTVALSPDRVRSLRDAVDRIEREVNHHARVEQADGTVTFEVWTHSLDRVTDMDVELARRIDEAVAAIGSSRVKRGHLGHSLSRASGSTAARDRVRIRGAEAG
jgi:pterin-4a-carbinolamine dehydratase